LHVLVVDDVAENTKLLASVLRRLPGVVPELFTSSIDALTWALDHDVALVLLDYHMPDLDGLAFLEQFHALPGKRGVPVVIVTLETDVQVRLRALDLGAADFILKPYRNAEIRVRVSNLLELQRARELLQVQARFLAQGDVVEAQ
jgi:DNA-binding response OmpR family regulator